MSDTKVVSATAERVEAEEAFWRRHLRLGFFVMIAESAAIGLYSWAVPGAHRVVLLIVAVGSAVGGLLVLRMWVDRIATRPWRAVFSTMWTLYAGVGLTAIAALDGGYASPLAALVPIPVVFAAAAFRPRWVAVCGGFALVEFTVLGLADRQQAFEEGHVLMAGAAIVGMTVVAIGTSMNRDRLEDLESTLTHQLADLASTDGLTHCLNHRTFTERLDEEIQRSVRHGWPLTVVVADIDDFKQVNDTYGHPVGDEVLTTVASALRVDRRRGDLLGRMGGDEFIIAMPNTSLSGGITRAKRVRDGLSRRGGTPVTVSMGVATLDPHDAGVRPLLEVADRALYHAKHVGRSVIAAAEAGSPQIVDPSSVA